MNDNTAGILSRVNELSQKEFLAIVHISKINSLIQAFKKSQNNISQIPPGPLKETQQKAIESLISNIDHLIQIIVQCSRESFIQFILTQSTQSIFECFLQIRQTTISDFQVLNLDSVSSLFQLTSDKLLSQDQVDLKLIGSYLIQIRQDQDAATRPDVNEHITARLNSLKRKGIKIEADDFQVLTIPSLPSNLNIIISHEQLNYKEEIGSGISGHVYRGTVAGSSKEVAIKVLNSSNFTESDLNSLRNEIYVLSTLSHPSILKFLGYTNSPPFNIVTEYQSNGSLFKVLRKNPDLLSPTDRTIIAIDVAKGMEYMHNKGIIHRDLKSLNILIDDAKHARICDFGLASKHSYGPRTGQIGTPQWMAPEIFMCVTNYDSKVDVFSYGIVLWELLTGQVPYEGQRLELIPTLVIQEGFRPPIPPDTPKELATLIRACWSTDPDQRPSFSHILALFKNKAYYFPGTDPKIVAKREGLIHKKVQNSAPIPIMPHVEMDSAYSSKSRSKSKTDDINAISALYKLRAAMKAEKSTNQFEENLSKMKEILQDYKNVPCFLGLDFMKELVSMTKDANAEQQEQLLRLMIKLLNDKMVIPTFFADGGLDMVNTLMQSSNESVAEAALSLYAVQFAYSDTKGIIPIESIKSLLGFASSKQQRLRTAALLTLFNVLDLNLSSIALIPSFLYHFLMFTYNQLQSSHLERLLEYCDKFIDIYSSSQSTSPIPDAVSSQLCCLLLNSSSEIQPKIIQVLVKIIKKQPTLVDSIPGVFWSQLTPNISSWNSLFEIIIKFSSQIKPSNLFYILSELKKLSQSNSTALKILISAADYLQSAEYIATKLPIGFTGDPILLFLLYQKLAVINSNHQKIVDKSELYQMCKQLIIDQRYQHEICQLMRSLFLNKNLSESSGLSKLIASMLNESTDIDTNWNLMSVLFDLTVNTQNIPNYFLALKPKLETLLLNSHFHLKMAAFLCLSNFAKFDKRNGSSQLAISSASFVNFSQKVVQQSACQTIEILGKDLDYQTIIEVCKCFLSQFKNDSQFSHRFAYDLLELSKKFPVFDQNILIELNRIACNSC